MKRRIQAAAGPVLGEVQPWCSHEIELRKVVSCAEDATDGHVPRIELLQTPDVHLGRAWLRRPVRESNRLASTVGEGGEPSELLARKVAKPKATIGLALNRAAQAGKGTGDGRVREAGGSPEPVCGYRASVGQPVVDQDLEHDEGRIPTGGPRVRMGAFVSNDLG